jgi:hypothetical protein
MSTSVQKIAPTVDQEYPGIATMLGNDEKHIAGFTQPNSLSRIKIHEQGQQSSSMSSPSASTS